MQDQADGPQAQGLYDPQHEHDACGVGFVVDIKGEQSHAIVEQGLQVLINLQHRGACGCEANTGDGAGILHPDARQRSCASARARLRAAAGRRVRRRPDVPAARSGASARRRQDARSRASSTRKARRCSAGATCRPTTRRSAPSASPSSRSSSRCSSVAATRRPGDGGRQAAAALRAQALRHPQAHRARGRRARPLAERAARSTSSACRRRR